MIKTFEDFLMEKHAEQYVGTKDCMVDDSADWIANLDVEDFIKYGDMFAKEQSKNLVIMIETIEIIVKRVQRELKANLLIKGWQTLKEIKRYIKARSEN